MEMIAITERIYSSMAVKNDGDWMVGDLVMAVYPEGDETEWYRGVVVNIEQDQIGRKM